MCTLATEYHPIATGILLQRKAEIVATEKAELTKSTKVTIDELSAKIAEGELKSLPVIVKADVVGSLEAIKSSLEKLRNDEVKVDIIHSGVGGITQNDVGLASASENCVILGFNIRPTGEVKEKAKEHFETAKEKFNEGKDKVVKEFNRRKEEVAAKFKKDEE